MEESFDSDGMLGTYLYESYQLLEQMEAVVISEKNRNFFDMDCIGELFRIMHTIKGSSGIMMYDNIAAAAHKLEDIFYYLRETGAEAVPAEVLRGYIFLTADFITGELDKIKAGNNPDGIPDTILDKIDNFLSEWKTQMTQKGVELPPENTYIAPNQYYIAPAAEEKSTAPVVIDLGREPDAGDYVINSKRENIIGISSGKLGRLTNLVEKLLKAEKKLSDECEWKDAKKKLMKLSEEIEQTVAEMRRAPLTGTFRKMQRIVLDASRKMNKDMEFEAIGEEVEVDRDVIECIGDVLMHIVRNAVDHGLEPGDERLKAGKRKKGKIVLEAEVIDDILYISVKDDGRGINKEEIFRLAKRRGLLGQEEDIRKYTDSEIYSIITYPGFTTKKLATEYSGRGVGMDVAVNKLKELGGSLEIESRLGKGTEMKMEVPMP